MIPAGFPARSRLAYAKTKQNIKGPNFVAKKSTLALVQLPSTSPSPPRKLGEHGAALWSRVHGEYNISDAGGTELLAQACAAVDRAEALAECVGRDGAILYGKHGPKAHPALKEELAARAFICRTLQRLGINVEAIKPPGRPAGHAHWTPAP
jgi:hypothetical protein